MIQRIICCESLCVNILLSTIKLLNQLHIALIELALRGLVFSTNQYNLYRYFEFIGFIYAAKLIIMQGGFICTMNYF